MSFSGDGGVEHMMCNLMEGMVVQGIPVDLVLIKAKGGHLSRIPPAVRVFELNAATSLLALPGLVRYLRRHRPAALLAAKDRAGRVAVLARRLSGVKARVGIRLGQTLSASLKHKGRIARLARYLPARWLYPMADELIAVSRGVADDMAAFTGIPRERFRTIANPTVTSRIVEDSRADLDEPWFRDRDGPVIVAAGRLTAQKDFPNLLRAFAALSTSRRARLIILGEGRGRPQLEAMVEDLDLAGRVKLPGFIANPYPYFAAADLFVLASRWEGSPNVLVEALALGTPVVATDCPSGPREILRGGEVGRLVPVGDPFALAQAMAATLDQPPGADILRDAAAPFEARRSARAYVQALGMDVE
ncbi:glycosyltransferase [Ectothiorhodospiraceae bacterium WFHF3C12]|nr:glycosyltransferase [Ectothiorhodospiraceae bacterium WFHF3C12]